jgi:hypothetical protein
MHQVLDRGVRYTKFQTATCIFFLGGGGVRVTHRMPVVFPHCIWMLMVFLQISNAQHPPFL